MKLIDRLDPREINLVNDIDPLLCQSTGPHPHAGLTTWQPNKVNVNFLLMTKLDLSSPHLYFLRPSHSSLLS